MHGLHRFAMALLLLPLTACGVWTVSPPAKPETSQPVFLLDHGRHASLVLPHPHGMVRYSYGQWDWYALNRTSPRRASGLLFGDSRATLGRRLLPGPIAMDAVHQQVRVPIEHAWRLDLPGDRVSRLSRRLDHQFRRHSDASVYNPLYDLEFVPHPAAYGIGHTSNHVVAGWLQTLGAEVDGGPPWSRWRVLPAPRSGVRQRPRDRGRPVSRCRARDRRHPAALHGSAPRE